MLEINELRERREREWRRRVMAVATEFGRLGDDLTALRLASEVLRLRDQLRRIATAVEWAQNGTPFRTHSTWPAGQLFAETAISLRITLIPSPRLAHAGRGHKWLDKVDADRPAVLRTHG